MIAKPAPVRREARRSPPVCCIPHSSQRFHVHRLHEQPPSLADCCLTHLGLQVLWKKLASAQSGSLLLVFVLCIMRLSPSFLVDFSHLLKPYYCSCKPYALPPLPLPFSPLVASDQNVSKRPVLFTNSCRASQHIISCARAEAVRCTFQHSMCWQGLR